MAKKIVKVNEEKIRGYMVGDIPAVSYTHLDVYKRQAVTGVVLSEREF